MKCKINNIQIDAIATCLPEEILEMSSLKSVFGDKEVEATIKNSGIERIHAAKKGQTTADLCFEAAELLIKEENLNRDEIDGLVLISQTFDYLLPATSVVLQGRLGLSEDAVCFDISYGCSGYIYGLFQAATLIGSGSCNKVLVLAGDTNTKIIDPLNKSNRMVFGDAGSATLVSKGDSFMGFHICSNGNDFDKVIDPSKGYRHWSDNQEEMTSDVNMKGDDVFSFIISVGPKSIKNLLAFMEWEKEEVDFYALHQATKITIDFMRKKLKLDAEKAPFDIMNYGNTGPTTVPLVLTDYPNKQDIAIDTAKWQKVILSAYGVGLSWGSVACDLSNTHLYKPINQ